MLKSAVASLLVFPAAAFAQEATPLAAAAPAPQPTAQPFDVAAALSDKDCRVLPCRLADSASIFSRGGAPSNLPVLRSPYAAADGTISVYPGEALVFDFPQAGSTPIPEFLSVIRNGQTDRGASLPSVLLAVSYGPLSENDTYSGLQINHSLPMGIAYDVVETEAKSGVLTVGAVLRCSLLPHTTASLAVPDNPGPVFLRNIRYLAPGEKPFLCSAIGSVAPPGPAALPPGGAPGSLVSGGCRSAIYPPEAVARHEEGEADVAYTVAADGTTKNIIITKSSGYGDLDQMTVACVAQFRYVPVLENGHPVEWKTTFRDTWKILH